MINKALKKIFFKDKKANFIKSFINGAWENGGSGVVVDVKDPATGELVYKVKDVSAFQIKKAFKAAHSAQEKWQFEVSIPEKEDIFRQTAKFLEDSRGDLAWVQIREGGRLWKFADAEVQGALNSIWHYHGELSRAHGDFSRTQMKDKFAFGIREPYGVILGITPWNSTLVLPSRKVFASLAGGNAIILKDPTETPLAASLLCLAFQKAMLQVLGKDRYREVSGIFQVLHGKGSTVGKALVEKGDYDKVTFTGSRSVGSYIAEVAGKRIKPVSLELGGHGAMIVMDDFDIDRAVSEAIAANCGDAGQRCVALRAVFVHKKKYDEFLNKYIKAISALKIGDPSSIKSDIPPLINRAALEAVMKDLEMAKKDGAKVAYGGKSLNESSCFFMPTVLTKVDLKNLAMTKEIFAPILSVIPFGSVNREKAIMAAVKMMNASNYGLSNAILTNDISLAMKAMAKVRTGVLYIGRGTTGAEEGKLFGGVKDSGFGKEAGGLEDFTYVKQVYIDYHGKARLANVHQAKIVRKRLANADRKTRRSRRK